MAELQKNKYKIKNYIVKNINLNYDIYISKPIFLTKNITNVKFSLVDNENNLSDLLENYIFDIIFASSIIYKNKFISNKDIFKYYNIPFELLIFHTGTLVIYDIPFELIKKILEYNIEITYGYFNYNNMQYDFEMQWNIGLEEKNKDTNTLRIMCGMIGCSKSNSLYDLDYNKNYIKNIYNNNNKNFGLNISCIDKEKNWIQYNKFKSYSIDKIVYILSKENNLENNFYDIVSETYKIPINKIKFINSNSNSDFKFNSFISSTFICCGDAIGNLKILCDNIKYKINKVSIIKYTIKDINNINNKVEEKIEKFELEYDLFMNGYEILGMNDLFVIPTVAIDKFIIEIEFNLNNTCLEINNCVLDDDNNIIFNKFNLFDDFWIQIDRIVMNTNLRRNIAQSFNDYEEYPIIDISDYLS